MKQNNNLLTLSLPWRITDKNDPQELKEKWCYWNYHHMSCTLWMYISSDMVSLIVQPLWKQGVLDWMSVSPWNPYVEALSPSVMLSGNGCNYIEMRSWSQGGRGRGLAGTSVHMGRQKYQSSLSAKWGHSKKTAVCKPGRGPSSESDQLGLPWWSSG